jgi:hypothetical protein
MKRVFNLGVLLAAISASPAGASSKLKRPSFFMERGNPPSLLEFINERTEDRIAFNRHFSLTFVPCGTGCGSFWFVDRRTGGVIEAPTSPFDAESAWDVRARPTSDVITVTYGPRTSIRAERCFARRFRWTGKTFVPLDLRKLARCPG